MDAILGCEVEVNTVDGPVLKERDRERERDSDRDRGRDIDRGVEVNTADGPILRETDGERQRQRETDAQRAREVEVSTVDGPVLVTPTPPFSPRASTTSTLRVLNYMQIHAHTIHTHIRCSRFTVFRLS